MYDQIQGDTLFIILYSVVTAMAMMASRIGSYMVYANYVSLLKRGYQAM